MGKRGKYTEAYLVIATTRVSIIVVFIMASSLMLIAFRFFLTKFLIVFMIILDSAVITYQRLLDMMSWIIPMSHSLAKAVCPMVALHENHFIIIGI